MFEELDQFLASDTFAKGKAKSTLKLKEGERREVCILFADVKGFTDLSEKLDHEEVQNLLDKLMQLFSARIKFYGGYVDKYEGDLVMALFGARVAREHDTERAILAALKMIEVLDQFNQLLKKKLQSDTQLEVRIGINTGWVTTGKVGEKREGDFTVYGSAVNLASRMEANAPVNRIMMPEKTMLMLKDAFEFDDHGEINVKGISEPISVFLVRGLKQEILNPWQTRRSAYVGREKELALLSEKYDLVKDRMAETEFLEYKPLVIGIKGEPGIGKSRLADEFLRSKPELPFYLHGTTPRITQPPFCMFTSMMRLHFGISQIEDRETTRQKLEAGLRELEEFLNNQGEIDGLRDMLPFIGRLLGVPYQDVRLELDPKELKPHLQTAIRYFLEAVAAKANFDNSPLVIVLEDLQWMDEPSAATFEFLMVTLNLEEKRKHKYFKHILILLNYRAEFKPSRQFKVDSDFQEIELKPVTESNAAELIESITGDIEIPEATLQEVMKKSAGNPFFIEEWINLILAIPESERGKDLHVPNTLHNLVLSRIDRLEKDVKLLLQKAAVIGREFFVKVLSEMEKKLERHRDISGQLEHLQSSFFIIPVTGAKISAYLFKQIITQEVAYDTLLIANRKILHRIAAEIIEDLFADDLKPHYANLGEHYEKAEITDKAIEYLKKAADYAGNHYQNELAIRLYDRLLDILDSDTTGGFKDVIIDTYQSRGLILRLIGEWKRAESDFDWALKLAEEIQDKKRIVVSLKSIAHQHCLKGKYTESMSFYKTIIEISNELEDNQGLCWAAGGIGNVHFFKGDFSKAVEYYNKQREISEELKSRKSLSQAVGNLGLAYTNLAEYTIAMEWINRQLEMSREVGNKFEAARALANMGHLYRHQDNYSDASKYYSESLKLSEELGDKHNVCNILGNMGVLLYSQGKLDVALEYYEKSLKISEELESKRDIANALFQMGVIHDNRGDSLSALKCFRRCLKIFEEFGAVKNVAFSTWRIGRFFHDQGDYFNATENYKKSLKIFRDIKDQDGVSWSLYGLGKAYLDQNEPDNALEHLNQALDVARELLLQKQLTWILLLKAKALYKCDKFTEAESTCKECQKAAKGIVDEKLHFKASLLMQRLQFAKAKTNIKKTKAIKTITDVLSQTDEEEHQAVLHYELWQMHNALNNPGKADNHRQEAISLYQELYQKQPKYEFKKRIEELEEGE